MNLRYALQAIDNEAREQIAEHRKAVEAFALAQEKIAHEAQLKAKQ